MRRLLPLLLAALMACDAARSSEAHGAATPTPAAVPSAADGAPGAVAVPGVPGAASVPGGTAGVGAGNAGDAGDTGDTGDTGDAGTQASDAAIGTTVPSAASDAATGATECAPGRYLICEDFEGATSDGVPEGWTVQGDASAVFVSDEQAHGGSAALKLGPVPAGARRIRHEATMLAAAHWGRVFYRVQLPVPDAFVHSTLVAFQGQGPLSDAAEYRVVDTVKQAAGTAGEGAPHQFLYNVQPQGKDEFATGTSYDYRFDGEWHCAEWYVNADTQAYRFFLDGTERLTIENGAGNLAGTDLPGGFSDIRVGWNNYQQAPPGFTAFIDDLAVDGSRIGCE